MRIASCTSSVRISNSTIGYTPGSGPDIKAPDRRRTANCRAVFSSREPTESDRSGGVAVYREGNYIECAPVRQECQYRDGCLCDHPRGGRGLRNEEARDWHEAW